MSESMLNKSFNGADLQRLRNLIQGKYGERSTIGVGYSSIEKKLKEGEVIEEDGRKWTMKDGIKQNITVLDEAKKEINLPLFCPSCSKIMKHQNDKPFYYLYKRCFNCQVEFETKLKVLGLWKEYEKNIINTDLDYMIKDFDLWFNEYVNQGTESFVNENGNVERWIDSVKTNLLKDKERTIEFLRSLKK